MDKQEILNEIEKLRQGYHPYLGRVVSYDELIILVHESELSKKREIPPKIAKRIEEERKDGESNFSIYTILLSDESTRLWTVDHKDTLMQVLVNGYTIGKEPVWIVVKGHLTLTSFEYDFEMSDFAKNIYCSEFSNLLYEDSDEPIYFKDKKAAEFAAYVTKGEIKKE